MPTPSEMIQNYLAGPATLRAAVQGMTREQAIARPIPGKWSTLELVCHLADFEPVYVDRMKRVIAMDKPLLMSADENLYVAKLAYHDRDLEEELATIEVSRSGMGRILKALPAADFQRVGVHNERGLRTLEQLLASAIVHIQHHVPFIAEKRQALAR